MARLEEDVRRKLYVSQDQEAHGRHYAPEHQFRAEPVVPRSPARGTVDYHGRQHDGRRQREYPSPHNQRLEYGIGHTPPKQVEQPQESNLPWHRQPANKKVSQANYRAALDQQVQSKNAIDKQAREVDVTPPRQLAAPSPHRHQPSQTHDDYRYSYHDKHNHEFRLQPAPHPHTADRKSGM